MKMLCPYHQYQYEQAAFLFQFSVFLFGIQNTGMAVASLGQAFFTAADALSCHGIEG